MPLYLYKAKNEKSLDVKGSVEAKDKKTAVAILKEKGLFCYSIQEKTDNPLLLFIFRFFKKISISEISTFTRQLSTMMNAGLPLTEALVILKSQGKEQMMRATDSILRDVEGGLTLSDAMAKYPAIFSSVYVALVKAGESAGVLDTILARLADNLETQREFQAKIKGALLYPTIIVVGMVGVMAIMMIFVIPKMTSLYSEFDAKMPAMTQVLLDISSFSVKFWWIILLIGIGVGYIYKMAYATNRGREKIDMFKFKIPIFGKLQKQVALAELTRTLGLLMGAGVSITEGLVISSKTANNIIIQDGIVNAAKQVEKGYPLSSAITENPIFPSILGQMLSVGEETGKMDEVLEKISRFYQSDSEESLKGLATAIEPIIMIVLGVGVGFLIIAIIMPIYNLTSQF